MTRPRSSPRRRVGVVTWTIGALVLLLVVGVAAATTWVWRGDVSGRRHAAEQVRAARSDWSRLPRSSAQSSDGQTIGVITIPRLELQWPIVAGTSSDALAGGVGWYRSTAWPGEVGNTALAGLRVTHGAPFKNLLDLRAGDEVVIETAQTTLRYAITVPAGELTVGADADWVLDPVPGHPAVAPNQPVLTLTTAQDLLSSHDRSVAFATLTSRTNR